MTKNVVEALSSPHSDNIYEGRLLEQPNKEDVKDRVLCVTDHSANGTADTSDNHTIDVRLYSVELQGTNGLEPLEEWTLVKPKRKGVRPLNRIVRLEKNVYDRKGSRTINEELRRQGKNLT
jgi:hypothetical protein